jgi:hypothetical protein
MATRQAPASVSLIPGGGFGQLLILRGCDRFLIRFRAWWFWPAVSRLAYGRDGMLKMWRPPGRSGALLAETLTNVEAKLIGLATGIVDGRPLEVRPPTVNPRACTHWTIWPRHRPSSLRPATMSPWPSPARTSSPSALETHPTPCTPGTFRASGSDPASPATPRSPRSQANVARRVHRPR